MTPELTARILKGLETEFHNSTHRIRNDVPEQAKSYATNEYAYASDRRVRKDYAAGADLIKSIRDYIAQLTEKVDAYEREYNDLEDWRSKVTPPIV